MDDMYAQRVIRNMVAEVGKYMRTFCFEGEMLDGALDALELSGSLACQSIARDGVNLAKWEASKDGD